MNSHGACYGLSGYPSLRTVMVTCEFFGGVVTSLKEWIIKTASESPFLFLTPLPSRYEDISLSL